MAQSQINQDLFVNGTLSCTTLRVPDSTIDDDAIVANAAIAATKLEHQYQVTQAYESATASADGAYTVAIVKGTTGALVQFEAGCVVPATGSDTCTVDLKKNGTTVLSAPITIDSSTVARTPSQGTFASTTLADGDWLEVAFDYTSTGGTAPKGVTGTLTWRELA